MQELVDKLKHYGTSTVGGVLDQLGIAGLVNPPIRAIKLGTAMAGPAFTVKSAIGELGAYTKEDYKMSAYIDGPVAGDILVIDAGGTFVAQIGGVATTVLARKNVAGVLIDGGYRDHDEIANTGIPFFARHAVPISGKTRTKTLSVNETVQVGGVSVRSGDIILADSTGVVVVPYDRAEEVIAICKEAEEFDERLMAAALKGHPLKECSRIAREKMEP